MNAKQNGLLWGIIVGIVLAYAYRRYQAKG